jgi:tRNA-dihydrouridine synthase
MDITPDLNPVSSLPVMGDGNAEPTTLEQNNGNNHKKNNRRKKQLTPASTIPSRQPHIAALLSQLTDQNPEDVDWAFTDPGTGTTTDPNYFGVLMNPEFILKKEELENHYKNSWELYKKKMNSPQTICAPMVEQSELPFRLLSRKYSIDLCYTPMINSNQISTLSHLNKMFETCDEDKPLTIQICGASIDLVFQLYTLLENYKDSITDININLGCPQGIAKRGRYGSFLLEETLHVQRIVHSLYKVAKIPVSVKMRKLLNDPTYERTIAYARILQDSGASIITLHGRTRNNKQDKMGQADLAAIKAVRSALTIPMFANGGVGGYFDAKRIQEYTGVDGVMISEGLLGFPTMIRYPIRRSQLLGKSERPDTEEGYYQGAQDLETEDERLHFSYPIFDSDNLKLNPFNSLPSEYQNLPVLSSTTSATDLERIDTITGPDPLQIAAELVQTSKLYASSWMNCLRPHLFKILQRELSSHTDIRMFYSMCNLQPRADFEVLQILRQRELYAWDFYKKEVLKTLCQRLSIPLDTPIEDINPGSLSKDELTSILTSFDFKSFVEHLDIVPYFSHILSLRKQAPLDDIETHSLLNRPEARKTAVETNSAVEKKRDEAKSAFEKERDEKRLEKEKFKQEQAVKRQLALDKAAEKARNTGQPCCDVGDDNNRNVDGQNDEKSVIPQIAADHPFPTINHPWVSDENQRLLHITNVNHKGKPKFQFTHSFNATEWYDRYEQYCIDNGYIKRIEGSTNVTTLNLLDGGLQNFERNLFTPTELGYNPNKPDLSNEWTSRVIHDKHWARIFNGFDTKSINLNNKNEQNIENIIVDVTKYIIPLPLESTWFFERLYSYQPHWYYRHGHQKEVIHVPVDEDSIKDQLIGMLLSRQEREKRAQQQALLQALPGPKEDERFKNKQLKIERKKQQRLEELAKLGIAERENDNGDTVTVDEVDETQHGVSQRRPLVEHQFSDDEKQPLKKHTP